jgi:hypothetical protein
MEDSRIHEASEITATSSRDRAGNPSSISESQQYIPKSPHISVSELQDHLQCISWL